MEIQSYLKLWGPFTMSNLCIQMVVRLSFGVVSVVISKKKFRFFLFLLLFFLLSMKTSDRSYTLVVWSPSHSRHPFGERFS